MRTITSISSVVKYGGLRIQGRGEPAAVFAVAVPDAVFFRGGKYCCFCFAVFLALPVTFAAALGNIEAVFFLIVADADNDDFKAASVAVFRCVLFCPRCCFCSSV